MSCPFDISPPVVQNRRWRAVRSLVRTQASALFESLQIEIAELALRRRLDELYTEEAARLDPLLERLQTIAIRNEECQDEGW